MYQGLNAQQLDQLLPYGMVATRQWLLAQGVSPHALDNALKSRRVQKQGVGVYSRAESPSGWQAVACSLQRMSMSPVLVGGVSALQLLGFGHYLSSGVIRKVDLYGNGKMPGWLSRVPVKASFLWHRNQSVWPDYIVESQAYQKSHTWRDDLPSIQLSCAEKAYLELLAELPDGVSFDYANELMQGMNSLSPRKLDELLKACKSVKVKRLFFWMADRHNYPWFRKLNKDEYDLGRGKRLIARSGKLDKSYLITVPEHLYGSE
ncbi:MAG: type IV toxin-antitoxin system AbiEi family antitoxin [Candidatus Thiodiazotropha sp.]|nr:type IV toxin-antitoxin system AbiEi family antitoxin [Candidatus Thiodiazotropha sp.]MCM8920631.1 type IV toxin-antitoxin system AbiEi family antitoxin [Candidatus Thiodiazotropha sp.]